MLIGFFDLFLSKAACTSLEPNPEEDAFVVEEEAAAAIGELWFDSPDPAANVQGANPRSTEPPVSDLDFRKRCHWLRDDEGLSTG